MCHENNVNSKTILSRKLKFWICSFGQLGNTLTKLNKIRGRSAWDFRKSAHLTWNDPIANVFACFFFTNKKINVCLGALKHGV